MLLLCGLAKKGYSIYLPVGKDKNYFAFSDGKRIFNANYDRLFGLTCGFCYVPNRRHGSSMEIAKLIGNDFKSIYKSIELYSKLDLSEINKSLNARFSKNKSNVKLYEDENDWFEKRGKNFYEAFKPSKVGDLKRGISSKSECYVIAERNGDAFDVSYMYQGLNDLNDALSTFIYNRKMENFNDANVNLLIMQGNKYAYTKIKTLNL